MSQSRTTLVGLISIAGFAVGALATGRCWAQDEKVPELAPLPPAGAHFLYLDQGADDPGHRIRLNVRYPEYGDESKPLEFQCDFMPVNPEAPIDVFTNAFATFRVIDARGIQLQSSTVDLAIVSPEADKCRFIWDTASLPDGTYRLRFELWRTSRAMVTARELWLEKLAVGLLNDELNTGIAQIDGLNKHLEGLGISGPAMPAVASRLAVARDAEAIGRFAVESGDWRRARAIATYLQGLAVQVRGDLTFRGNTAELANAPVIPDLTTATIEGNGFSAQDKPVILLGARVPASSAHTALARLKRYGLGLAVLEPGVAGGQSDYATALSQASQENIAVIASLMAPAGGDAADYLILEESPAAADNTTLPDIAQARAKELVNQPSLLAVSLVDRPRFVFSGGGYQQRFAAFIRDVYGNVYNVNLAWKSRLREFDEIPIDPSNDLAIYQYDLQTFDQQVGTQILAERRAAAATMIGRGLVTTGLSDDVLEPGVTRYGIDQETLLASMDIIGCTMIHSLDIPAQESLVRSGFLYTLFTSLAPRKPLVTLSQRFVDGPPYYYDRRFEFVHALAWDSAISGSSALAIDGWNALGDVPQTREAISSPDALDGLVVSNVELNRLASLVRAFQRDTAKIGIVWSQSSQIYADGEPFLPSVARAYGGAAFAGRKVRFISESQCIDGTLDSLDVVIIPQLLTLPAATKTALDEYIKAGKMMVRTTTPIPYDARGQSQHDALTYTKDVRLIRGGEDEERHYLAALDALYYDGKLREVPRLVNDYGYPILGLKTLSVEFEGSTCLYILNMTEEPVTCQANGAWSSGRNLLDGQTIDFPATIQPLVPMLIKIDPPADGSPLVVDGPRQPSRLKPVPSVPREVPTGTVAAATEAGK
jgi:uncharacterized membrane protein